MKLFCGRRKDRIKGLLWDETGFLLLYKRLENGQYQWPDTPEDLLYRLAVQRGTCHCAEIPVFHAALPPEIRVAGRNTVQGFA